MKAKSYKTGTTPIKLLLHPRANCARTTPLDQPLSRPTVFTVVNTVHASPRLCKTMKSSPQASGTFGLFSQCPDAVTTAAAASWRDSRKGGTAIGSFASPGPWMLATGKRDRGSLPSFHQGISDT